MTVPYNIQPLFPYVEIKIGGVCITQDYPKHLVDFTFERTTDAMVTYCASKFTFSAYDDTAIELEHILLKGYSDIEFTYGWSNTAPYVSKTLKGNVSEYSLNFEGGAVTLEIVGMTQQVLQNNNDIKSIAYSADKYHGKASDIVRAIAQENGWTEKKIEETTSAKDESGAEKTFQRTQQNPLDFINTVLCETAESAETKAIGYYCYVDENNCITFEPKVNRTQKKEMTKPKATYEYYCGRTDNSVISFSPEFQGAIALGMASNLQTSCVDTMSNEMLEISILSKDNMKNSKLDTEKYCNIMGLSSGDIDNLKRKAVNMWNVYAGLAGYTANLEILGDPYIGVGDCILVYLYTKQGLLHHTSGTYYIQSATDSISGGTFTTSLSLFKMADINGNTSSNNPMEEVIHTPDGIEVPLNMNNIAPTNSTDVGDLAKYLNGSNDIVDIALRENGASEGNGGDDKYLKFMGISTNQPWCASFVSWCAGQAGYQHYMPRSASVADFKKFFEDRGQLRKVSEGYRPKRGDLFIQKENGASHIGFVVCDNMDGTYTTIEGNSSDRVKSNRRRYDDKTLSGFGVYR